MMLDKLKFWMFDMVRRPWFSRGWVIQEFALPSNMVVLRIGERLLDAFTFTHRFFSFSLQVVWHEPSKVGIELDGMPSSTLVGTILSLRVKLQQQLGSICPDPIPFSAILDRTRMFGATDTRDKVYGCLGLASKAFRASFDIDYQESLDILCARLTRRLMELEGDFTILQMARFVDYDGGPSWAFNPNAPVSRSGASHNYTEMRGMTPNLFRACGPHDKPLLKA